MPFKISQLQSFSLAGSGVSIGQTTMTLSSFQTIDGVDLTMSDFGDTGYMTVEPGSRDREEQISFSGVTQNVNGTATLTGIKTVLFLSPYTETSGFSKSHPGGVSTVVTNTSGFYNKLAIKDNDETITGFWKVQDPVSSTDIANRQWVLSVVNGGPVSQNSVVEAGIAGETLVAGNLIYFSETDNEWRKTAGTDITTLFNVKLGIAQGAGTNGNSISGGVLTFGDYTTSGLTQGDILYAGNTAGSINSGTSGTVPRVIGVAKDTTTLYFDPNFQGSLYNYAVDAVGTDAYAITLAGALSVPFVGMEVKFKAGTANTGACTLAINGGSAKTIKKDVSTDLTTGDILANQIVTVVYDGTNWQMSSLISGITSNTSTPVERVYNRVDSPATWTKPAGLKYITVEVQAAGGGSGSSGAGANNASGGAGAGGYGRKLIAVATLGATETVTIGGKGTGGAAADGTDGGNSSFGAHVVATGGGKSPRGPNGNGTGGGSTGGTQNITGQDGSLALLQSTGGKSGIGGSSMFGFGGQPSLGAGNTGSGYGSGASGAFQNGSEQNGADGKDGQIIVTEYYN